MKRSILAFLILLLIVPGLFADEYADLYDLIVPESFTFLTIDGGLGSVGGNAGQLNYSENIIEITAATGAFTLDAQVDGSYRMYEQTENSEIDYGGTGNVRLGTVQTSIFASPYADYTSYGLDISGMDGFWYAGGTGNINASTTSLTFTLNPSAAIGVGRVYTIYNVYRAKLMMEHLGVTPTSEKVKAVVSVFQKSGEIFNRFNTDSTELSKEYYQRLADAMGIPNRAIDILILNTWNSQKYAFDRARFVGMVNGWDARLAAELAVEKNWAGYSFGIDAGPEAQIGGFLMDDMLYFDADASVKIDWTLNGATEVNVNTEGRVVYLPDDYRWWAEAIAEIDYLSGWGVPFQIDIAGAGYYLIDNNFRTYAGLRLDETAGFSMFAGGEIRLW